MDEHSRGATGAHLSWLVRELLADGELDEADLARIAEVTANERARIVDDREWQKRAHVHDEPHVSVITTDDDGREEVDASGVRCHDCGRDLVSDVGSLRILVCPSIHGRRPSAMLPVEHGAVECGRSPEP